MFIQLNPFASPNYISTSQTEKLAMFLGHCSPQATPGHCLPGRCFPCIEIFPRTCAVTVQTAVCQYKHLCPACLLTRTELMTSGGPLQLCFLLLLGEPSVDLRSLFIPLLSTIKEDLFIHNTRCLPRKKNNLSVLVNMGRQHRRGLDIIPDFFYPFLDLSGISPFSEVMSSSFHW